MKKFALLIALLGILVSFNPPAHADLYSDGIKAYNASNYELAEHYFREALNISPVDPRYHYFLAITLVKRGNVAEAETEYKSVIRLDPDSQAAYKAKQGLTLIAKATNKLTRYGTISQPTAMTSVLTSPSKKVVIPIRKNDNAIIVSNVGLNDKENVNFILDTGATYTSISRETAYRLGLDLTHADKVNLKTANGLIQVPRVRLESVNINGLVVKNIEATVHSHPAAQNVTGLLGLSFLENFTVTIDSRNSRVILESL